VRKISFLILLIVLPGVLCFAFASAPGGAAQRLLLDGADNALVAGDYDGALKKYKKAYDADPECVRALIGMARLYSTAEDPEFYDGSLAVEYALMALDRDPGNIIFIETLAEGYFALSRFERAVFELDKCIAASPENLRFYQKLRRYALTWSSRLVVDNPGRDIPAIGKAYFQIGRASFHLGDFKGAVSYLDRAYERDRFHTNTTLYLSRALTKTGDPDRAVEVLQDLGDRLSRDPLLLQAMGRALVETGDLGSAVRFFNKARGLAPDLEGLLIDLGKTYLELGDNALAIAMFSRNLESLPPRRTTDLKKRTVIHTFLARAYEKLKEYDKAMEYVFQAVSSGFAGVDAEEKLRALFNRKSGRKPDMRKHFAAGRWPAAVIFSDVSKKAGVSGEGGVSWGDYDQDGDPDLLLGGTTLYRNDGRRGFRNVTAEIDLVPEPGETRTGGLFADIDHDGDLDILRFDGRQGHRDRLFRNDGRLGFRDAAGKNKELFDAMPTMGGVFGDFDGDGDVDIYIVNGRFKGKPGQAGSQDSVFVNAGNGTFLNKTEGSGVVLARPRCGMSVAAVDYDDDGDMDISVANGFLQPDSLWRNEGDVRFVDMAAKAGAEGSDVNGAFGDSRGVVAGDLNNDGAVDLFLASAAPFQDAAFADKSRVLLNSGRPAHTFRDAFSESGLLYDETTTGAACGDVDNDGDLDLFLSGTGLSRLYVNDGDGKFIDATWLAGLFVTDAAGCAFADHDGDGDLDIYVSGGGGRLFENSGNENHWIAFRLAGRNCNTTGIGSRITIDSAGRSMVRSVPGGRGAFQDDMVVHFGLGSFKDKVNASIQWPNGKSVYLQNLKTDRIHTVRE